MTNTIHELRLKIDDIDSELISLLAKRLEIVAEIGKIKKESSLPPLDKARWDIVLETRKSLANRYGLSEQMIEDIFQIIHLYSLETQK